MRFLASAALIGALLGGAGCATHPASVLDPAVARLENMQGSENIGRVDLARSARALENGGDPQDAAKASRCLAAYENLYRNSTLDIRVAFGYKDARPARFVGDRYERAVYLQHLTAPCRGDYQACGFERDPDDADLLRKQITGPDGLPRQVELRVSHASVGPGDEQNRTNPFQRWQSRHAQRNFLAGLERADIVFYNGHSRDGGGPDFRPPRLMPNNHIDYGWYLSDRGGARGMLGTLARSAHRPRALGLFSCVSEKHFSKALRKQAPGMALITSQRLLYYADAIASSLGALNAILSLWCEEAFDEALQSEAGRRDTRIEGFFGGK